MSLRLIIPLFIHYSLLRFLKRWILFILKKNLLLSNYIICVLSNYLFVEKLTR